MPVRKGEKQRKCVSTRAQIIEQATRILLASPAPMTIRQTYYRLVVEGFVENIPQEYKRVIGALTVARENDDIPYDQIVDNTRFYSPPSHGYDSPEEYVETLRYQALYYRANPWEDQDHLVIGVCEKDAMTAVLGRIASGLTDDYPPIPFTANKGYSSLSLIHEMAESIKREARARHVTLLYFGDFDPSGEHMCPSPTTMHELGEPGDLVTRLHEQGCEDLKVVKVALTYEQYLDWFEGDGQGRLPYNPNPIKDRDEHGNIRDTRAVWFKEHYGEYGAELDAVPIDRLRTLLIDQLDRLIDSEVYHKVLVRQERDRQRIEQALSTLTLPPESDE